MENKSSGTTFPFDKFIKAIKKNTKSLVVIITDFEINNMKDLYDFNEEAKRLNIPVFILKIMNSIFKKKNVNLDLQMNEEAHDFKGIKIIDIYSLDDLVNLTLKISKKYYT